MLDQIKLDQIKIASPCTADWDSMEGDDRVRFCAECQKRVYNLSAMTRSEAESLLQITRGQICARLYRRADGTVLTEDCPVGLRVKVARVRRRLSWAISGAISFAAAFGQKPPALSGVVEDPAMAVIANASITIVNVESGTKETIKAGPDGKFTFESLSPGTYTLTTTSPGFKEDVRKNIVITENGGTKLQIMLQIGEITMGGPMVSVAPAKKKRR